MENSQKNHLILENEDLDSILKSFLLVKKSENRSAATIRFYRFELSDFICWFNIKYQITKIFLILPTHIRKHLSDLGDTRNKGGIHARYRSIKAFLNFYTFEYEPQNWSNPIDKVKVSTPRIDSIKGIDLVDFRKLVESCKGDNLAKRDRAIFLCLLSSGLRASEFLNLDVSDVDLISGQIDVRHGKGDKSRTVFISQESRKLLRSYLRTRSYLADDSPIWVTYQSENRLLYSGLRSIVRRRATQAKIKTPLLHDYRRTFALEAHRANMPILIISKLLGHNEITITTRYLRIDKKDLEKEYSKVRIFD